jgi:hypothetical protein
MGPLYTAFFLVGVPLIHSFEAEIAIRRNPLNLIGLELA